MFKKTRYGIAILSVALPFVAATANANFGHCTKAKGGTTGMKASLCDVTFFFEPAFVNMCATTIQSGVYVITNNASVPIKINYIRIQVNDALPAAASAIVTAPPTNCVVGGTLAPGAFCNIQVNLLPLTAGTYSRILQVGINTRQGELDSPIIDPTVTTCVPPIPVPPLPASFACTILGAATVTNTGGTAVTGNVCLSPGTSITGFPPGTMTGVPHAADLTAALAQTQDVTAYNNLKLQPCTTDLTGDVLGTGGTVPTLTPGVYCFSTSAQLTGALTLAGAGTYVFQIGSTLTTASASSVILTGGATDANIYWAVGSAATLGTTSVVHGNILALASITLNTGATLDGRALVQTGAVTLDTNAVNPTG